MTIGSQRTSKYEVIQFLPVHKVIMATILSVKDKITICIIIHCNANCYFYQQIYGWL